MCRCRTTGSWVKAVSKRAMGWAAVPEPAVPGHRRPAYGSPVRSQNTRNEHKPKPCLSVGAAWSLWADAVSGVPSISMKETPGVPAPVPDGPGRPRGRWRGGADGGVGEALVHEVVGTDATGPRPRVTDEKVQVAQGRGLLRHRHGSVDAHQAVAVDALGPRRRVPGDGDPRYRAPRIAAIGPRRD